LGTRYSEGVPSGQTRASLCKEIDIADHEINQKTTIPLKNNKDGKIIFDNKKPDNKKPEDKDKKAN